MGEADDDDDGLDLFAEVALADPDDRTARQLLARRTAPGEGSQSLLWASRRLAARVRLTCAPPATCA